MAAFFVLLIVLVIFILIRLSRGAGGRKLPAQRRAGEQAARHDEVFARLAFGGTREGQRSRRAPVDPDQVWVPAGRPVEVAGYTIHKGMLYVGDYLQSAGGYIDPEPALINPRLPVNRTRSDSVAAAMGYWPSYSTIDPASRAGYLQWLAGGCSDPGANIGYVFLYFYGLERRSLIDATVSATAGAEIDGIRREVERLLAIYRGNNSFRGYAGQFLDTLRLRRLRSGLSEEEPPLERSGNELPILLRVALGQLLVDGRPVPPRWAFAWLMLHPEARLRTPAKRCPEQFKRLFEIRYTERHGEGLRVAPNKTKLIWQYHAASASFARPIKMPLGDLPDVSALTGPLNRLMEIADRCADELQPFSRFLASPDADRRELAAAALLPAALSSHEPSPKIERFRQWIESQSKGVDIVQVSAADLIQLWSGERQEKVPAKEATLIVLLLEKLGYGMEPDPRFGASSLKEGEKPVLFRLGSDVPKTASSQYGVSTALAYVGMAVANADGMVDESERDYLVSHIESAMRLSDGERRRLRAHLRWLADSRVGLAGLRRRMEGFSDQQKQALAAFSVGVAGADGRVEPAEIRTLTKLYPLLGLRSDDVYTHLHALMSSTSGEPSRGPVTVQAGQPAATGFPIPLPEDVKRDMERGVSLDMRAVSDKMRETAEVSALLSTIFIEDASPVPGREAAPEGAKLIGPLDAAHSELLRIVARSGGISRGEFEQVAARLGLLPDGALELINDAAFELSDRPLCEGEDPIVVDVDVAKEIVA